MDRTDMIERVEVTVMMFERWILEERLARGGRH
jgi:hypothetical protein